MPQGSPLVTVIVPTRNRRVLLERTLRSVLWQTHQELEVIVVDEASSDDTPAWLAAHDDARLRVLRNEEPGGVARARNRGLDEARGEYVAFTDDDDLWAPDKVEAQLAAIASTPGARWSFVGAIVIDPALRPIRWQRVPSAPDLTARLLQVNEVPGGASGVLAERALVEDAGRFDPTFKHFADWDLWQRLALRAPAAPVARPLLGYLRHRSMSTVAVGRYEDIDLVEAKYASERAERGVPSPRVANLHWIGEMSLRAGDRAGAREAYAKAATLEGNRLSGLRLALSQVPGYLRLYDELKRLAIPREVLEESRRWLAPLRPTA